MRPILILVLLVVIPASTFGQDKSWMGESVFPTKNAKDIKLRVAVGAKEAAFPYSGIWPVKVRDDRGGSIQIDDTYRLGWADKADFVLVQDAPAYFDRRVQANPKDTYALFMRGSGLSAKGEQDRAIKDFDECIRLSATDAGAYNGRANAWYNKMDLDKAIADYTLAIRHSPRWALAYFNRGNTWNDKKDHVKAIADYNQAMVLDPNYLPVLTRAAWLLATCPNQKVRNGKRAVELAKKALNANKQDPKTMDTLAAAYACAGNFTEAVRWQERALEDEQFMNNADARSRLELYRKKQPYRQE
jgi:tetratricopeptide (TPR) repeat protein